VNVPRSQLKRGRGVKSAGSNRQHSSASRILAVRSRPDAPVIGSVCCFYLSDSRSSRTAAGRLRDRLAIGAAAGDGAIGHRGVNSRAARDMLVCRSRRSPHRFHVPRGKQPPGTARSWTPDRTTRRRVVVVSLEMSALYLVGNNARGFTTYGRLVACHCRPERELQKLLHCQLIYAEVDMIG
jgi:hypothetical protein